MKLLPTCRANRSPPSRGGDGMMIVVVQRFRLERLSAFPYQLSKPITTVRIVGYILGGGFELDRIIQGKNLVE